ncbi:MAG: ABC transporter permease subunit [Isosphaeraceae bacterium]
MIPGPVFQFELLTTARRGRFYVMRAAYAAILLLIFWAIHTDWSARANAEATIREMSGLAIICFGSVAVAQVVVVLCLTPALAAGVIADERQRKTLHYLMASRLTGPEIVIGKLLARMLHVGVLLAVGFPILSLLVLLGGIDPMLIALACGAAASTAWLLATLSIWVSTVTRRARDALFVSYGLEFLWLFLPTLIGIPPSTGWRVLDRVVDVTLEAWRVSSPVGQARGLLFGVALGGGPIFPELGEMISYQLIAGLALALLAAVQVRPAFRALEGGRAGRRLLTGLFAARRPLRLRSRPSLGDRPMLWKELFTARARGFARFVGLLVTLTGGGFLVYYTAWFGALAFLEMWGETPGAQPGTWLVSMHRWQFLGFLQAVVPLVFLAGILSVAGAAAASITSEHEEDTWVSLTSTDLTGGEIILAKLFGALWRPRMVVSAILLMALAGVLSRSIHPLSLPALILALAVFGWFAAALGVCISLRLRSTWRAQFLTTSCLLLINLLGQAILSNIQRYAPLLWPGFMPTDISKTIISPSIGPELESELRAWGVTLRAVDHGPMWSLLFWVLSLASYLAAAIGLTLLALRQYEGVAGRARRGRTPIELGLAPGTGA